MFLLGLNLQLTDGWFPTFMKVLAIVFLVAGLSWAGGIWKRQLLIGLPVSIGLAVLLYLSNFVLSFLTDVVPIRFWVWLWAILFAIVSTVILFIAHARWWFKVIAILSILITSLTTAVVVNKNYGYYPTLKSLFGQNAANESSLPALKTIQDKVRTTGKLPTYGVTLPIKIPATLSNFSASVAYVYLPPEWFATSEPKLPVIELFGGTPSETTDWTRAGHADTTADAWASAHQGDGAIIVMPDINGGPSKDSECVDTTMGGNAQTYLAKDVPAFIIKTFNAAPDQPTVVGGKTIPSQWATAGLSEGGTCAAILGLRYPKQYPTFADYSGDSSPTYGTGTQAATIASLFGGNQTSYFENDPASLLIGKYPGLGAWFAVGTTDFPEFVNGTKLLAKLAEATPVQATSVCLDQFPGAHDFYFWTEAFKNSYPWLMWRLGVLTHNPETPSSAVCQPAIPEPHPTPHSK